MMKYPEFNLPANLADNPVWIVMLSPGAVACYHVPTQSLFEDSITLPSDRSDVSLRRLVVRAFRQISSRIPKAYKKVHDTDAHTLILVDAPWAELVPHTIESSKTQSAPVTRDTLTTIIHQSTDKVQKDFIKKESLRLPIVASETLSIRLNGYATEVPVYKEAKTITTHSVALLIDTAFRAELIKEIMMQLHTHTLVWGSCFIEQIRNATRAFSSPAPSVHIRFGASATECMFWDGTTCSEFMSNSSLGAYACIDRCAEDLGVDRITARSYLAMLVAGESNELLEKRLKKSLQTYHDAWLRVVYEYFHAQMQHGASVEEIYVSTDGTLPIQTIAPDSVGDFAIMQTWWPALHKSGHTVHVTDGDEYSTRSRITAFIEALVRNRFSNI